MAAGVQEKYYSSSGTTVIVPVFTVDGCTTSSSVVLAVRINSILILGCGRLVLLLEGRGRCAVGRVGMVGVGFVVIARGAPARRCRYLILHVQGRCTVGIQPSYRMITRSTSNTDSSSAY